MKVLLINPPYQTVTSNLGVGHQVPLGLIMVGGPLIDAGFEVRLLDAEALHLSPARICESVAAFGPDVVMTGHAGSTPAHPVCMEMLRVIKRRHPSILTIYGGVFPTYHSQSILRAEPAVDIIVRGEGEATAVELMQRLQRDGGLVPQSLRDVQSITFRAGAGAGANAEVISTPQRRPIRDLDDHRTGWELVDDWDRYQCFGLGRAAIVQFSRGCPHRCTYCGQHGFWVTWRHRDPEMLADEIARLHDEHDVRFITLADENPTTSREHWRAFLEALAIRARPVQFFSTIRATDIVRDADMLELYRRAGILYVLLGIDATKPETLEAVNKRSTAAHDQRACCLLKQHGIRSIIGHIVGLGSESWTDFRRALRSLLSYDGDLLNVMYATPHAWTAFARESVQRGVVQENQAHWDYRHQVLGERLLQPWQLFAAVKWLELAFHLRPGRMWRMVHDPDAKMRRQLRWTALHTGAVWLGEIAQFVTRVRHARRPQALASWLEQVDPSSSPRKSGESGESGEPGEPKRDAGVAVSVRGGPLLDARTAVR